MKPVKSILFWMMYFQVSGLEDMVEESRPQDFLI